MTRGSLLLERKRAATSLTYRELAKELGCSVATAHRLCHGDECRDRRVALAAFRLAGVPLSAWDDAIDAKKKP